MEITEVRIKLVENARERLRAFCSITLDGAFVIRDLKIIDGTNGVFVAMPSRKLMDRCPRCGSKNHLRSRFCNDCGASLNENRAPKDTQGRAKLHADVAHPINAACREQVQKAVVEAYQAEQEKAKSPDYKPAKFDDFDDYEDVEDLAAPIPAEAAPAPQPKPAREPRPQPRETPPAPVADARAGEGRKITGDHFGDYNSLIADLKRDAQSRRQPNGRGSDADHPATTDQTAEDSGTRREATPPAPRPSRADRGSSETAGPKAPTVPPPPQAAGENDSFGAGL
ncbi:MAG: SpoVG family protein [Phycisphaerae bacterium]|nr:SpoVG family protein [Phycisphaerae bacterium]